MDSRDLKVNQRVEIEVDMTSYQGVYPSRVEEVDEKGVYLAVPIKHGALIPLRVGEPVKIYFLKDQQVYCLRSEIVGRKLSPVPEILVAHSRNIVRVQRRNWVRLEISLPVILYYRDGRQERVERGRTLNISGGGVLFVTRADWLRVGDPICVRIELPEREPFISPAVVRRVELPEAGTKGYRIACEFVDIRESQRDVLVKFIFAVQRERLKKGLY